MGFQDKGQSKVYEQGFTIIEILVAIALLGILTAVLTATLTGSLSLNRQSQKQLDTTTQVQGVLENVRAAWKTQSNYDNACAPGVTLPSGYSIKFINLNSRAAPSKRTGPSGRRLTPIPPKLARPATQSTSRQPVQRQREHRWEVAQLCRCLPCDGLWCNRGRREQTAPRLLARRIFRLLSMF